MVGVSWIFYALAALPFAYAALWLFYRCFGEKIAFPAPKPSYKFDAGKGFVSMPTDGGAPTVGLWFPKAGARRTLLYSHGNGEDLGEIRPILKAWTMFGFNVLGYDYAGYGRTGGKPSAKGLYASADAAWNWLVDTQKIAPETIIVLGFSMGGAAASYLAAVHHPRALVLVGAFASALHVVLPINPFPWVHFLDNRAFLRTVQCPVYLLHGTRDRIVPVRNAHMNFKAIRAPKWLAIVRGAGHYRIPELAPDRYWFGVESFAETLRAENSDA